MLTCKLAYPFSAANARKRAWLTFIVGRIEEMLKATRKKLHERFEQSPLSLWIALSVFTSAPIIGHIQRLRLPDTAFYQQSREQALWTLPIQIVMALVFITAAMLRLRLIRIERRIGQQNASPNRSPAAGSR